MADALLVRLKAHLLDLVPADGASIGNTALRRRLEEVMTAQGVAITADDYWAAQEALVSAGSLVKGQGRGGSVRRAASVPSLAAGVDLVDKLEEFNLLQPQPTLASASTRKDARSVGVAGNGTQRTSRGNAADTTQIISYRHADKRKNNPEVGIVTPETDPEAGKTRWAYDPHLDPAIQFDPGRANIEKLIDDALESGDDERMREALAELKRLQSPYLNWAGKAERTSFDIDTVSLHVHERIDPASILSVVRKAMKGDGKRTGAAKAIQPGLFDAPFESLPLRDAIDFYRHERGWANRLIAGDSLLVMN